MIPTKLVLHQGHTWRRPVHEDELTAVSLCREGDVAFVTIRIPSTSGVSTRDRMPCRLSISEPVTLLLEFSDEQISIAGEVVHVFVVDETGTEEVGLSFRDPDAKALGALERLAVAGQVASGAPAKELDPDDTKPYGPPPVDDDKGS